MNTQIYEVDDKNQGVYKKEEPMNTKACHL